MKNLLIIPIALLTMYSCNYTPPHRIAQEQYHIELYETTRHFSSLEAEDVLDKNNIETFNAYGNEETFITRHRTSYGGYTPPILYRWYNNKEGYRPAFVLNYNPKEFSKITFEDQERFFPRGRPDTTKKHNYIKYTGK